MALHISTTEFKDALQPLPTRMSSTLHTATAAHVE
jgi:hypothetical protein